MQPLGITHINDATHSAIEIIIGRGVVRKARKSRKSASSLGKPPFSYADKVNTFFARLQPFRSNQWQ